MDFLGVLIIVIAVAFIFLLWVIVGVRHLKYLRRSVNMEWEHLAEKIAKRQNLIPLLIEIVRRYFSDKEDVIEDLIAKRAAAVKESRPGAKKIELEHDLTESLKKIFELAAGELAKDTNFLEVKKDFKEIGEKIHTENAKYNEMVRKYNQHRNWLILRPLALTFRLPVMNIFEVEI